jgi:hypothetical protein
VLQKKFTLRFLFSDQNTSQSCLIACHGFPPWDGVPDLSPFLRPQVEAGEAWTGAGTATVAGHLRNVAFRETKKVMYKLPPPTFAQNAKVGHPPALPEYSAAQVSAQKAGANLGHQAPGPPQGKSHTSETRFDKNILITSLQLRFHSRLRWAGTPDKIGSSALATEGQETGARIAGNIADHGA